uniref:Chromosome 4 open reading frame 54 n=1 Tax=Myripristis murdjan TaxID=586833 RepID=A0A667ZYH1_9TELE
MEAVEKTLTYRNDTGLYRKLLPEDKDNTDKGRAETKGDESNYVDLDNLLDVKSEGAKTVKVTFTGEGNQLAVIKCDTLRQGEVEECSKSHDSEDKIISDEFVEEHSKAKWTGCAPGSGELPLEMLVLTKVANTNVDSENGKQLQTELDPSDCNDHVCSESDELQYTDMYLNSRTESDDGASAVLSDHCESDTVEDESHYITTHEIQLTELDHDVDYDLGRGTCWDFEDDNLVYSFVDYASFESDETQEGTLILEGRSQAKLKSSKTQSNIGGAVVSTEQDESDLCDSDKCPSSDESICKNQCSDNGGNPAGQIHLSIKTSSRAVNEPENILDNDICGHRKHVGDRGHFFFASTDARADTMCDTAQYFIPAPGRQHLATKLRGKDINEYSSGASSSISELDDADKEVRNLTAKSFRSLACPYFDAINLRTSSESSVSEYGLGLNKWSAYVDLNYGNISRGRKQSVIAHKSSSATLAMSKAANSKSRQGKGPFQPKPGEVITMTETLNFRCNVDTGVPEGVRHPKCSKNVQSKAEVTGTVLAKSGCELPYQHNDDSMGDTHKRAIFASSLLKNVISKKMQFEQERKMERGEISDTYPTHSPCFQCKDQDVMKEKGASRGVHRQTSETGSGFTVNSVDDQTLERSRPSSCEPTEEQKNNSASADSNTLEKGHNEKKDSGEPAKGHLNRSQNSAFTSWREGEPEPEKEPEVPTAVGDTKETTAKEELDASGMLTKLSQLFVPSSQLLTKEKDIAEDLLSHAPVKAGKPPEIKICLRSVKENKDYTLNIANLLTPKISYNTVNTLKTAGDTKCQVLSTSDKIPSFTVRDIRDTKCKFQTPIYHVRDVRKLVKSSYRFVSLDNSDSKTSAAPSAAADTQDDKGKKQPVKHSLPSPIVIKCHSVKTKSNVKQHTAATEASSQKQAEAGRSSPKISPETSKCDTASSHCMTSRMAPVLAKQLNPDQSELHPIIETKLAKQRQEKMPGDTAERRNEPKIPKQAALEKLKAAVKTMEQLYVFDRNEWKRKTQAPQPITDSHVLSLIAREEQGVEEPGTVIESNKLTDPDANTDRISQSLINTPQSETCKPREDKGSLNIIHVPYSEGTFKIQSQQNKTFSNKSVLHFGNSGKTQVSISSLSNNIPQSSVLQTSSTVKGSGSKTAMAPLSLKIAPPKRGQAEQGKVKSSPTNPTVTQGSSDSENYLAIPGLGYTNEIKLLNHKQMPPQEVTSNASQVHTGESKRPDQADQALKMSQFVLENQSLEQPASSIYHYPAAATAAPQSRVLCFSPIIPTLSPTPSVGEAIPQTQRKMLLDPTTGHYYLVDTPIQATTKRLFDPETGQYVDVPMPHSPVAPVAPVAPITPVPMSVSPLALSPGAYAPTYMIYPGFIPSPTLPAQPVPPQTACLPGAQDENGEQVKHGRHSGQKTGAESPYYSATGEAAQVPVQLPVTLGHVTTRGSAATSERKPVISITTQQGPRIIAPPSFDGTTMSFVVEHR